MNYEALNKISYGLFIVSSVKNEKFNAYIANTVFQVTAEPAKLAISCSKDNHTHSFIEESGVFSVSVLGEESSPQTFSLFGYQSGQNIDKFEELEYKTSKSGAPIVLEDAIAWFDCKVVDKLDVGTHIIYIGEILESDLIDDKNFPITYEFYKNVKKGVAPKNAPTHQKTSSSMKKPTDKCFECLVCGYLYKESEGDPDNGIEPGTKFEDLPEDYCCPVCGAGVEDFEQEY